MHPLHRAPATCSASLESDTAAGEGTGALRRAVWRAKELAKHLPIDSRLVERITRRNRLRIPLHYLERIQEQGDALWLQAVPDVAELDEFAQDPHGASPPTDFLAEDDPAYSPVPHLTHRYPDRTLLLVTDSCPLYCRFCMRKRKTLRGAGITQETIDRGISYIRETRSLREVILSGGDPLMLPDRQLSAIVGRVAEIPHVETVRIHTRMPVAEPARITNQLGKQLVTHAPLSIAVHINHPRELSPAAEEALGRLRKAGLPLLSQSVLLRNVNDNAATLADLYRRLLRLGVHPYYLHHSDQVPGSDPFRVPIAEGRRIVSDLRARVPLLVALHYVLDTPGGGEGPAGVSCAEPNTQRWWGI